MAASPVAGRDRRHPGDGPANVGASLRRTAAEGLTESRRIPDESPTVAIVATDFDPIRNCPSNSIRSMR